MGQREDDADSWAACLLQRKRRRRKARLAPRRIQPKAKKSVRKHLRTSIVQAPMYFGESCLWVPYSEWGDVNVEPLLYQYNVRCESRVELVHISRDMVKEVLMRFDPWLPARFEFFRTEVVAGLHSYS